MADDFSDDVFESPDEAESEVRNSSPSGSPWSGPSPALSHHEGSDLRVRSEGGAKAVSPTGYRDYIPPPDLLRPPSPYKEEIAHKTILLGDSGVGKTSLLVQFDTGTFQTGTFSATVGIGFTNKVVTVDDTKIKLQIWDTAGQERFRSVTHAYYRDAHALLLLYDVTNKTSFDNIRAWLGEINEYAQDDVVIMLLGNKADCNSERVIRREDGERLASEYNVAFMETSAKTGMNVELAFMAVARHLHHINLRELISRKTHNPGEPKFNVREYVESQSQKAGCNCNA